MNTQSTSAPLMAPHRGSLLKNTLALYILQIANYVIPVITLPYLIRTLGEALYGAMAVAYALVYFMVLCVDAGINSRAVRELSRSDISHQTINEIYLATQWTKLCLLTVCFATLLIMIAGIPALQERAPLLLASFMMVFGSMVFSTWLFQGLEVMHITTLCTVAGRLLTTLGIFVFVKGPEDLQLAAFLQASATATAGLLSMGFVLRQLRLSLVLPWPKLRSLINTTFSQSRGLWFSEFSTNAVSSSGVFILSLFAGDAAVGIFAAIEKIFSAALNAFQPLQKALLPKMAALWRKSRLDISYQLLWTKRLITLAFLGSLALYLIAPQLLQLLFGSGWAAQGALLQIIAVWLFLAVSTSTFNQLWLLASGEHRLYSYLLIAGAALQLIFSVAGAAFGGAQGMIIALAASQFFRLLATAGSCRTF